MKYVIFGMILLLFSLKTSGQAKIWGVIGATFSKVSYAYSKSKVSYETEDTADGARIVSASHGDENVYYTFIPHNGQLRCVGVTIQPLSLLKLVERTKQQNAISFSVESLKWQYQTPSNGIINIDLEFVDDAIMFVCTPMNLNLIL